MLRKLLIANLLFSLPGYAGDPVDLMAAFKKAGAEKIRHLGSQLTQQLTGAMQAGGPVQAVNICNLKAPEITRALNRDSTVKITRTSLKLRNPDNRPDAWEQQALQSFERQFKQGRPVSELVYAEKFAGGQTITLRMIKAIPTQGLCLTCHGHQAALAPPVLKAIKHHYPDDQATGYSAGQIRGAFSLTQTIDRPS